MSVKSSKEIPFQPVRAGEKAGFQVLISAEEAPHFAMRRFLLAPGGWIPPHTNTVEHEQYVLRGRARLGIGEQDYEVSAGDVVFIPAGAPHWYRNEGTEDFEFLCLIPNQEDRMTLVAQGG